MVKIKDFHSVDTQVSNIGHHVWSVARLHQLSKDLPVMEVPLNHLNVYTNYQTLTLRDLVMHMKAVNNADLSYPIILDEDGDIMDGRHRIMKCLLEGIETIKAVRFEENPSPCEVREN